MVWPTAHGAVENQTIGKYMKKTTKNDRRALEAKQLEVALIDLHIRQLQTAIREQQAVVKQLKMQRDAITASHKKKRRRKPYDADTPLWKLIKLEHESGFKTMITEWQKYTTDTINPYKTSYFNFSNFQTIRLVYIALARFLHIDCREINVKPMAFYRYLSLHSNLGSEVTIKTGLCRARKWLQENDIHRK